MYIADVRLASNEVKIVLLNQCITGDFKDLGEMI